MVNMKDAAAREKLFKKFKSGDGKALGDILEAERHDLYDYLMRMTGQMSRSQETIDEVYQALTEETLEVIETYVELRVCIYTTARKFNADIWNAETSRLSNAAVAEGVAAATLDKALRSLGGREREAVYLGAVAGFSPSEAAEIMSLGLEEAERRYRAGVTKIDAECSATCGPAASALADLPRHPIPPRSSQATVNLSMVMQGIKTKPVGLWSPVRIGALILVLALITGWFIWPRTYSRIFAAARHALHLDRLEDTGGDDD